MPGLLLNMIKELPYNQRSEEYMPLSRVQIYSAEDDSMSLNLFVYGEEPKQLSVADVTMTGSHILEYAQQLMDGCYLLTMNTVGQIPSQIRYLKENV